MAVSLGQVTVAAGGTPSRASTNLANPTSPRKYSSLMFQARPANTGIVYVLFKGDGSTPGDDRTTRKYVLAILPAPASATQGPFSSYTVGKAGYPGQEDITKYWIDVSANGDGVIISAEE